MKQQDIYNSIAQRTGGDIYIGVVGPVRTGKSTFIKRFMETLVIPHIPSEYKKERAVDELPQSSAGKTIMTTEPKFIPEEAVEITLNEAVHLKVRMIDCVGYIVPSSLGYIENEQPRMVRTPWFEEEIPFNMAAEVGTQKVIQDHSTIGLVVTTDGSISDIPREEYEQCEERVINELKDIEKPFIILMNCLDPRKHAAMELCQALSLKYQASVIPVNCLELDETDIRDILTQILFAFPIKEINIDCPRWITGLKRGHWLKEDVFNTIRQSAAGTTHLRQIKDVAEKISECQYIPDARVDNIDLGNGSAKLVLSLGSELFYKILGEETGIEISSESDLLPLLRRLTDVSRKYEKIESALAEVEATGYGIVMPSTEELSLEEPEIVKQGGRYGVRLRASAPSIHLMKAGIQTEVSPIVGSEKQSEELVRYLLKEFEESPSRIWESNIFGKSLHDLVNEGLHNKLYHMPVEARMKLQETIERIINEGCSGLICFIL